MKSPNGKTLITQRKIRIVKNLLKDYEPLPTKISEKKTLSLRDIASIVHLSYSVVWKIWKGFYEQEKLKIVKPKPVNVLNVDDHWDWVIGGIPDRLLSKSA